MAIYHFDASVISRSKGRSATAAAAYRTAAKIEDHRTGEVHDYTRKGGVLHTEIVAPDHAPSWAHDRADLWNAVEQIERRKDAQVAREVRVALPSELTTEQNAALVRAFVQDQFVARGMVADVALHAPGREGDQRNHHAHIMLTTREIGPEGFEAKNRDWNAKDLLVDWRQSWAEHVNDTLERYDIHERVDHRTLAAQREEALSLAHEAKERGDDPAQAAHMARAVELDRPALPGMSAGAWSMMRRGLVTPAAERWQEVRQIAAQAHEIAAEFKDWARDWLERPMSGMQERTVAIGPSERLPAPPSPLDRLRPVGQREGPAGLFAKTDALVRGFFGGKAERDADKTTDERQAAPDHRTPESLRQIRALAERALDMLDRIRALPDRKAPERPVERVEAPSATQRILDEAQRAREARERAREAHEAAEARGRARDAALGIVRPPVDPFAHYRARSGDDYSLTNNREEHLEVVWLLKENTTEAQYDRFRRGDLTAIDHITNDPVFSRQLLMQAELNNRHTGFQMSWETENVLSDHHDFLNDAFETDRDRDYGHER